jgi:predicted phosphodiesterase
MYAVISDIHGNLEALEAVLSDVPEEVQTVYCLGDVIGYGANPDECCDVVRSRGMPTISGNHDLAVTDLETDLNWFNPTAAAAMRRRSSSTALYEIPTSTSSTRPPRRTTSRC